MLETLRLDAKGEIIRRLPIFSGISEGELMRLSELATEITFKSGEYIFHEGDVADYLYIIANGRVKSTKFLPSGKEFTLDFFDSKSILSVQIFADIPHICSAIAVKDTRILSISKVDFLAFLSANPRVATDVLIKMLNIISARVMVSFNRLANLAFEEADQRIMFTLFKLYNYFGPNLTFTREQIGQMSGTATETATRFLTHLKQQKVIHSMRGKIIIIDEAKFKLLSQDIWA